MGAMSSGGFRGSIHPQLDERNTWTDVQVFQQGFELGDSAVIGSADGSAFELGAADENVRVMGELDVFSTTCTIRNALYHRGTTLGFYNTAPIAKQTGVAVSTAAIHAALVNLGLIAA